MRITCRWKHCIYFGHCGIGVGLRNKRCFLVISTGATILAGFIKMLHDSRYVRTAHSHHRWHFLNHGNFRVLYSSSKNIRLYTQFKEPIKWHVIYCFFSQFDYGGGLVLLCVHKTKTERKQKQKAESKQHAKINYQNRRWYNWKSRNHL